MSSAASGQAANAGGGMASGASSFIGALISLISRSDIRYQGFLATIDAEKATIALEKVRTWGTEGRMLQQGKPASEELPPNENVYDHIVFRASDVKDLKIDDPNPQHRQAPPPLPPPHQDPAILGSSGYPHSAYGRPPPPPPPGAFGRPPYPGFGGPGMPPGPPHFSAPGFPGTPPQQQQQQQQQPPPPQQQQPPAAAAAPPPPPPPQQQQQQQQQSKQAQPSNEKLATAQDTAKGQAQQKDAGAGDADTVAQHLAGLSMGGTASVHQRQKAPAPAGNRSPANLPPIPHAAAAAAAASGTSDERRGGGHKGGIPGSGGRQRGAQSSVFDNPRSSTNGKVDLPDADFDFDASNAKFSKPTLGTEQQATADDDAHNELASIPPPSNEPRGFYDKTSFFDNISNDVTERQEARVSGGAGGAGFQSEGGFEGEGGAGRGGRGRGRGRAERLAEDRRNMATFGEVGGNDRGRGGGRGGRGRGRGRGRGQARGGFRGGRGGAGPQSAAATGL